MGLIPAPEPKVKISNLARVLGEQGTLNPTKIEQYVREQMDERLKKHEMSNLARKLTPAERREKTIKKMKDESAKGDRGVALYRIDGLFSDPRKRFKVDMNARQLYLTGICVMVPGERFNLVVVEGGERSLRKFKKLMLRRIKWAEETPIEPPKEPKGEGSSGAAEAADGDEAAEKKTEFVAGVHEGMACNLVWEGAGQPGVFKGFRLEECKTVDNARHTMTKRNLGQYVDMCVNYTPVQ